MVCSFLSSKRFSPSSEGSTRDKIQGAMVFDRVIKGAVPIAIGVVAAAASVYVALKLIYAPTTHDAQQAASRRNDDEVTFVSAKEVAVQRAEAMVAQELPAIQQMRAEYEATASTMSVEERKKKKLVLEETLTVLLIKLDGVDVAGREGLRVRRRQLISAVTSEADAVRVLPVDS